jgi:acyl-CoA synthetase (NDP forming)
VTNAGGPGIMATDACIRYGLKIARFQDYTIKSLRFQMPATGSIRNPVDVIGDAKHDRYRAALDAVTADEGIDQVAVIVTPQMMTDIEEIARVIVESRGFCHKPIIGVMMGSADMAPAVRILHQQGVPTFTFPEDAMRALAAKARFAEWVRRPIRDYRRFEVERDAVGELFERELQAGRVQLVELPALDALRHYGFPTVPYGLAKTADEAVALASQMGYPVVMKISGPKILHKTDVGGVRLSLAGDQEVRAAFDEMVSSVRRHMGEDIEIWGVLIQKMLEKGKEIILGMTRDAHFGPLLMFGLGGIYTEALRDVAFRLAPIRENVAAEMVKNIRAHRLLEGVRGEPPSDTGAVAECLMRLSQLVTDHPRIQELDINPLMVYPRGKGAIVADARIILKES